MASVSSYIHHQVLLSEVEAVLLYFKCGYNVAPVSFFLMQFSVNKVSVVAGFHLEFVKMFFYRIQGRKIKQ